MKALKKISFTGAVRGGVEEKHPKSLSFLRPAAF